MKAKQVKKEWKDGKSITQDAMLGDWNVIMYGWMSKLWWLKGDQKRIYKTGAGSYHGYNVLPNGKQWGWFRIVYRRSGLLLNYSVSPSLMEKPIRDVVRCRENGRIVGRFRYLGILTGWFTLEETT